MNDSYISAIKEMRMVDQELRKAAAGPGITQENYMVYLADQCHNWRLHRLIEELGYPTVETIGADTLADYWLLIQHQDGDLTLQKECLKRCNFAPKERAYLTDRILANSGQEQEYGTQMCRNKDGKLEPKPIRDLKSIDARRKEVGLDSISKQSGE